MYIKKITVFNGKRQLSVKAPQSEKYTYIYIVLRPSNLMLIHDNKI